MPKTSPARRRRDVHCKPREPRCRFHQAGSAAAACEWELAEVPITPGGRRRSRPTDPVYPRQVQPAIPRIGAPFMNDDHFPSMIACPEKSRAPAITEKQFVQSELRDLCVVVRDTRPKCPRTTRLPCLKEQRSPSTSGHPRLPQIRRRQGRA